MIRLPALSATVLLLFGAAAYAQDDELPAVGTQQAEPAPPPARAADASGTTIIGERESPIGLFITPWRDSLPESDMDRPARLMQEDLVPLDEEVFVRQIEYYNALDKALKAKGVVTPLER
ncbi:MAG: hypothetical protein PHP86_01740 [Nevskiales bacterium]|nr:hypothetical protein [Nevskiales bacterium]